jgi:hypothetical protein
VSSTPSCPAPTATTAGFKSKACALAAANETCLKCHSAQRGPFVFEHEALREAVEVHYTGKPNSTYGLEGEWVQGSGNVEEEPIPVVTPSRSRCVWAPGAGPLSTRNSPRRVNWRRGWDSNL